MFKWLRWLTPPTVKQRLSCRYPCRSARIFLVHDASKDFERRHGM